MRDIAVPRLVPHHFTTPHAPSLCQTLLLAHPLVLGFALRSVGRLCAVVVASRLDRSRLIAQQRAQSIHCRFRPQLPDGVCFVCSGFMDNRPASRHGFQQSSPPRADELVPSPWSERSQREFPSLHASPLLMPASADLMAYSPEFAVNAFPSPPHFPSRPTPAYEGLPDITIPAIASAALPPLTLIPTDERPSLSLLQSHKLRFPSLDPLGIASPSLIAKGSLTATRGLALESGDSPLVLPPMQPVSLMGVPYAEMSPGPPDITLHAPLRQFIFVQTPPSNMPEDGDTAGHSSEPQHTLPAHQPAQAALGDAQSAHAFHIAMEDRWLDDLVPIIRT
jgi:hypothetical protein